jgi:hypothetical protein
MEPIEFDPPREESATFKVAYQRWLRDPVTREVFRHLELVGRPQPLNGNATGETHAYSNGIIRGYWQALDLARSLDQVLGEVKQPTAGYTGEGN